MSEGCYNMVCFIVSCTLHMLLSLAYIFFFFVCFRVLKNVNFTQKKTTFKGDIKIMDGGAYALVLDPSDHTKTFYYLEPGHPAIDGTVSALPKSCKITYPVPLRGKGYVDMTSEKTITPKTQLNLHSLFVEDRWTLVGTKFSYQYINQFIMSCGSHNAEKWIQRICFRGIKMHHLMI